MALSTVGIVLIKDKNKDVLDILDKVKDTLEDFYYEKVQEARNKSVSVADELKKFRPVDLSYTARGSLSASFGFYSELAQDNEENRNISVHINTFENDIKQDLRLSENIKPEGILFSLNKWGSSDEILIKLLENFGDKNPAFLIRNDAESSKENVVKIGNAKCEYEIEYLSKEEYQPLRKKETDILLNKFSSVQKEQELKKKKTIKPR